MEKFKTTPLELDNTMPKELYSLIENKWHYCLNLEKEIREYTLANSLSLLKGRSQRRQRNMEVDSSPSIEHLVFYRIKLKMLSKEPRKCGK